MPPPKNYIKIQYPRKCNQCDYLSNNPQMWHYHSRTHISISSSQLCDHGCGKPANFFNTNGKYTCVKISQQCSEYIKTHSDRIKEQWTRPESIIRKEKTKETFLEHCVGNKNAIAKSKETKRKKELDAGITDEIKQDFDRYSRMIRRRGVRKRKDWALSQGYKIGKHTYHIDHKLSVYDSWKAGLSEEIVNHPANLQIVEARKNLSKGSKSLITVEELLESIKAFSLPG